MALTTNQSHNVNEIYKVHLYQSMNFLNAPHIKLRSRAAASSTLLLQQLNAQTASMSYLKHNYIQHQNIYLALRSIYTLETFLST